MEVVTGAMGSLLPKLGELLMEEYNLQKGIRKDVESLCREMKSMHAALLKVAEVPRDQLDEQVKLGAGEIRELSYDMEDIVDRFLVRVDGCEPAAADNRSKLKRLTEKMGNLFTKGKARRQIANAIKDINKEVQEVANRRARYTVEDIMTNLAPRITVDPRLRALYIEATELVGIYGKRDEYLLKLLSLEDDDPSKKRLKTVSVVGFGGLGKTTLVRAVYDKIKEDFDCHAFVPVGRNPELKKVFRDILIGIDKQKYTNFNLTILDEKQLTDELRDFLHDKRYLVVIDDVWDENPWKDIKSAFSNMNNLGSRLIITTRKINISRACSPSTGDSIYHMEPLSTDDSTCLFHKRVFSSENECPPDLAEVSRDILKKCGGVPLAIITIASLLASDQQIKPKNKWHVLLKSIGRGLTEDASVEEMLKILSFSYYDLPSHLKTCLLYLSMYPEDHKFDRNELIWKWICENFVQNGKQETNIFEVGESYFNELINRSLIQPVYNRGHRLKGCRVHDMVLDLICSLSREENFVTILDGSKDNTCCHDKVRRLSLQSIKDDQQTTPLKNSMSISQIRSVTIFSPAINIMPTISTFAILGVLDLRGCDLSGNNCNWLNLKDVGHLFHLRYLGLRNTGIRELPTGIASLQFLQVLDVRDNYDLKLLPSSVLKLKKLMVINVPSTIHECFPDELGSLTSLEVLSGIYASLSIVQQLGNLARLRKLKISFSDWSPEMEEAFVESICNLRSIQILSINSNCVNGSRDLLGERWVPPQDLREFQFWCPIGFPTLPAWITRCGPLYLSNLSKLVLIVKEMHQEDVEIFRWLPALRTLSIRMTHQMTKRLLTIEADGFPCLICFGLYCKPAVQVVFQQGGEASEGCGEKCTQHPS